MVRFTEFSAKRARMIVKVLRWCPTGGRFESRKAMGSNW